MLKGDPSSPSDESSAPARSTTQNVADDWEFGHRQRMTGFSESRDSVDHKLQSKKLNYLSWHLGATRLEQIIFPHRLRKAKNRSNSLADRENPACGQHPHSGEAAFLQKGSLPDLDFRILIISRNEGGYEQILTVYLPRTLIDKSALLLNGESIVNLNSWQSDVLSNYFLSLARELPSIPTEHWPVLAAAGCTLVQACLCPTLNMCEQSDISTATALRERVRRIVRQQMNSPDLRPEVLGRLVAMSRSKLYRIFESTGGVARFIQQERLSEARRRLADTSDKASIRAVASETGFLDHSTFSRAFKQRYGSSPSKFRETASAQHLLGSGENFDNDGSRV